MNNKQFIFFFALSLMGAQAVCGGEAENVSSTEETVLTQEQAKMLQDACVPGQEPTTAPEVATRVSWFCEKCPVTIFGDFSGEEMVILKRTSEDLLITKNKGMEKMVAKANVTLALVGYRNYAVQEKVQNHLIREARSALFENPRGSLQEAMAIFEFTLKKNIECVDAFFAYHAAQQTAQNSN